MVLLCSLLGCNATTKPDAIPELRASNSKTTGLIDAAQTGVEALRPLVEAKAIALVDAIEGILGKATASAEKTDALIEVEAGQKAEETRRADRAEQERDELLSSWGHRLQVWVTRLCWVIVIAVALHVVLGIGALFVRGPAGSFAAVAGGAMAFVSQLCNPLGWFGWIRDNLWFRVFAPRAGNAGGTAAPTGNAGGAA